MPRTNIYATVISKDLKFLNIMYDDNFAVAKVLFLTESANPFV